MLNLFSFVNTINWRNVCYRSLGTSLLLLASLVAIEKSFYSPALGMIIDQDDKDCQSQSSIKVSSEVYKPFEAPNKPNYLMHTSSKFNQINHYLDLTKKYGNQLGKNDVHIPELSGTNIPNHPRSILSEVELLLAKGNGIDDKNRSVISDLFAQVKKLDQEKMLSFPRFKLFLMTAQALMSNSSEEKIHYKEDLTNLFSHLGKENLNILNFEEVIINKFPKDDEVRIAMEDPKYIPVIGMTPAFGVQDANYYSPSQTSDTRRHI